MFETFQAKCPRCNVEQTYRGQRNAMMTKPEDHCTEEELEKIRDHNSLPIKDAWGKLQPCCMGGGGAA